RSAKGGERWKAGVLGGGAPAGKLHVTYGKEGPPLAGRADSEVDQLGPPDLAWLRGAIAGGSGLRDSSLEPFRGPDCRHRAGLELARRQPRRHPGPLPSAAAPALWLLCRPHGGQKNHTARPHPDTSGRAHGRANI